MIVSYSCRYISHKFWFHKACNRLEIIDAVIAFIALGKLPVYVIAAVGDFLIFAIIDLLDAIPFQQHVTANISAF